jgi:hypothetical protein
MATLGAEYLTLADWGKRIDSDGKISRIAEFLNQRIPILQDLPFIEANDVLGHRCTVRTGLPTAAWKKLNRGVAFTKSRTAQVTESIGIQEQRSALDEDHPGVDMDLGALRLSEAAPHVESIGQEFSDSFFYGTTDTAPEEIMGLAPRYNSLSANNAQNIIDGGGTGSDNSSIWLLGLSPETICGIFPKGSRAGITHTDLGKTQITDTDGNWYTAYLDQWKMKAGVCVKDWRYAVRIANIDVSNAVADSSAADLAELMITALNTIEGLNAGRTYFYMNRTLKNVLDLQRLRNIRTGGMTYRDVDGKMIPHFQDVPIHVTDSLTETEAQIT